MTADLFRQNSKYWVVPSFIIASWLQIQRLSNILVLEEFRFSYNYKFYVDGATDSLKLLSQWFKFDYFLLFFCGLGQALFYLVPFFIKNEHSWEAACKKHYHTGAGLHIKWHSHLLTASSHFGSDNALQTTFYHIASRS